MFPARASEHPMAFLAPLQCRGQLDNRLGPSNVLRCSKTGHRPIRMTAVQPQLSKPQPAPHRPQTARDAGNVDYLELVLTSRVYDVVKETPLEEAPILSARIQNKLLLKREDTTDVKSFKLRGAYNMMAKADSKTLKRGVVAASAGNHAQGVALAAQKLGISSTIVMPAVTPKIKVDAVKRRGGNTILHGDNFDVAKAKALEIAQSSGLLFVPPFDHPEVIAGQGTVGLELLRQSNKFDAVFVPVGGGGLVAGIATVIKRLRPDVRIIGVEPYDANAMYQSLNAGKRVTLDSVGTFADGVAVVEVGIETFRLCQDLVDEVVLVDTDEICAAMKDMFEETRSILEPAGALAVAGAKAYVKKNGTADETYVAITSGANTNFDRLRHVSERAEIGEGREAVLAVTIPERPGSFSKLLQSLGPDLNITEFNYRYRCKDDAHVFVGATVSSRGGALRLVARLEDEGYNAYNLTDNEMAKLHIRHLIGGRSESGARKEAVYRFEFPERPGALSGFLEAIPVGFDISLFHYRNHGADVGRVLVGLVALDGDWDKLELFVQGLGYRCVREDDNLGKFALLSFFLLRRTSNVFVCVYCSFAAYKFFLSSE